VNTSEQNVINQSATSGEEVRSAQVNVDPDSLPEIELERQPEVDLTQYALRMNKIARVTVVRIKSPYAIAQDGMAHSLKVEGEVVQTLTKDDGTKIEFRPSELISLQEDPEGKLSGFPKHEKSKWQRFKKTMKIVKSSEAIGKELPIRINENKDGRQFLGYMY
jgi:hypothetical protein